MIPCQLWWSLLHSTCDLVSLPGLPNHLCTIVLYLYILSDRDLLNLGGSLQGLGEVDLI